MRQLLWLLIFAAATNNVVAGIDPLAATDLCIERLFDTELAVPHDEPIEEILLICPELDGIEKTLDPNPLDPNVGDLSLREVIDLRHSLRSYRIVAQNHALDRAALPAIVQATLQAEPEKPPTWWEQFDRWLGAKTSPDHESALGRFLDGLDMPQWMEKVLLRSSIVIIIVLALVTVLNEMQWLPWRLPGLWRKRKVARLTDPQRAPRSWEELSALPLRAQGAALFHWVFAQLAAKQLVHEQVAHTHREHAGVIATDMPAIAIPIHDLALAAERSIYASTDPSADEVEQWRDTARAIERELAEIKA